MGLSFEAMFTERKTRVAYVIVHSSRPPAARWPCCGDYPSLMWHRGTVPVCVRSKDSRTEWVSPLAAVRMRESLAVYVVPSAFLTCCPAHVQVSTGTAGPAAGAERGSEHQEGEGGGRRTHLPRGGDISRDSRYATCMHAFSDVRLQHRRPMPCGSYARCPLALLNTMPLRATPELWVMQTQNSVAGDIRLALEAVIRAVDSAAGECESASSASASTDVDLYRYMQERLTRQMLVRNEVVVVLCICFVA